MWSGPPCLRPTAGDQVPGGQPEARAGQVVRAEATAPHALPRRRGNAEVAARHRVRRLRSRRSSATTSARRYRGFRRHRSADRFSAGARPARDQAYWLPPWPRAGGTASRPITPQWCISAALDGSVLTTALMPHFRGRTRCTPPSRPRRPAPAPGPAVSAPTARRPITSPGLPASGSLSPPAAQGRRTPPRRGPVTYWRTPPENGGRRAAPARRRPSSIHAGIRSS